VKLIKKGEKMRKKSKTDVHVSGFYVERDFWLKFVKADGEVPYRISKPERLRRLMAKKIEKHEKEGE
jgi:hypothetical protein